jgi:hypothetical protein
MTVIDPPHSSCPNRRQTGKNILSWWPRSPGLFPFPYHRILIYCRPSSK